MNKTLTLAKLKELNACQSQVDLFERKFGSSVRVTQKLCASVAGEFDFIWAARHLLSAPAWAECDRVTAPARAECDRVTALARAGYRRAIAVSFAKGYNS